VLTSPSNHKIRRITKIVQSIGSPPEILLFFLYVHFNNSGFDALPHSYGCLIYEGTRHISLRSKVNNNQQTNMDIGATNSWLNSSYLLPCESNFLM